MKSCNIDAAVDIIADFLVFATKLWEDFLQSCTIDYSSTNVEIRDWSTRTIDNINKRNYPSSIEEELKISKQEFFADVTTSSQSCVHLVNFIQLPLNPCQKTKLLCLLYWLPFGVSWKKEYHMFASNHFL
jgi:hypothetical protein